MKIFEPFSVGSMTLPNRLVLPAMVTRLAGEDGHVNDDIRTRYTRFSKGGVGLVVVEAMAVHSAKSGPLLRISDDAFKQGLRDLAARCHDAGPGKVVPQIIHFLKIARSGFRQTVDMLSLAEIDAIVDSYAQAALRARECGFDGVELHMAHAYTLASFLSRLNPRKDDYGGSLANRLHLPLRVIARVREFVGHDFPIGIRYLGDECIRGGYTVLDAAPMAVSFARAGVDYLSLSAGGKFEDARVIPGEPLYPYTGYSGDRCMPSASYPDGCNLYIPEAIRLALTSRGLSTPVVAAGKIATMELAQSALDRGQADLIGMARALLADPDLPKKWANQREDTVVRCLYGNVCKTLDENFKAVKCTLWPKSLGRAPDSDDTIAPVWGANGAALRSEIKDGRVLLRWSAATDNEMIYGYEVMRTEGTGILLHYASVRGASLRFEDNRIEAGCTYRYAVRPYDLAGNRGPLSESVAQVLPANSGK